MAAIAKNTIKRKISLNPKPCFQSKIDLIKKNLHQEHPRIFPARFDKHCRALDREALVHLQPARPSISQ